MKSKLAMLAAASALFAAPALAACPDNALQTAVNIYIVAATPNTDKSKTLAETDAIVAACPTNPYVLKIAATTYATVPVADPPSAVKNLARSRELFRQMWANLQGSFPPIKVAGANNTPVNVGFDDLYNLETQVRNLLLTAEQVSNTLAPEDMPIGQGAPMRACYNGDSSDAQRANAWLKEKDHPGAFNLLDRIVAYCSTEIDQGRYTQVLGQRARALLASAKRTIDKTDAASKTATLDKLKRAKADGERYYKAAKKYDYLYWSEGDVREVNALILKAGGAPPKEMWFKPPYLADPATLEFIALSLDAAWAEDAKLGIGGRYKIYRDAIGAIYPLASTSGDPKAARKLLFNAAKAHAEGRIRGPGNGGLKAPPDYLYKWIDPDFVPPPAALPATLQ